MSAKKKKKEEPVIHVDDIFDKISNFYQSYKKQIDIGTVAVLLIIAVIVSYYAYYMPKQQAKADVAIFRAEQYFAADSLYLALNGDGMNESLLDVIDSYGRTKTGNRAKYMAGVCYLKLGEFDDAISYLKKVKAKDKLIPVQTLGLIADAYVEQNELDKALSYYKKAIKKNPNELLTPIYLKRAAWVCEMQENWKDALKFYNTLQKEYPNSMEASEIDKNIEYVTEKGRK